MPRFEWGISVVLSQVLRPQTGNGSQLSRAYAPRRPRMEDSFSFLTLRRKTLGYL